MLKITAGMKRKSGRRKQMQRRNCFYDFREQEISRKNLKIAKIKKFGNAFFAKISLSLFL
jgi:hypothetical protein